MRTGENLKLRYLSGCSGERLPTGCRPPSRRLSPIATPHQYQELSPGGFIRGAWQHSRTKTTKTGFRPGSSGGLERLAWRSTPNTPPRGLRVRRSFDDNSTTRAGRTATSGDNWRQNLGLEIRTGGDDLHGGRWSALPRDHTQDQKHMRLTTISTRLNTSTTHVGGLMDLRFPVRKGSETTAKNDKSKNTAGQPPFPVGDSGLSSDSSARTQIAITNDLLQKTCRNAIV